MSSVFSAIIRNVRTICVICAKYKKPNKKTDLRHLRKQNLLCVLCESPVVFFVKAPHLLHLLERSSQI